MSKVAPTTTITRHYRPLGVSLAIIFALVFYGLQPLLLVFPAIWSLFTNRLSGIDFVGGTWGTLSVLLGIFIIGASLFAWRGRPRGVRLIFILLVWTATLVQLIRQIPNFNPPPTGVADIGTGIELPGTYYACLFMLNIGVPLYVTWYLNRAPARAFYDEAGSTAARG